MIIIGAGAAGISCAKELQNKEKNISIMILESQNRIGGRINTVELDDRKIELGASYIHGASEENPVYSKICYKLDLAKSLNLNLIEHEREPGLFFYDDGSILDNHITIDERKEIKTCYKELDKEVINLSYSMTKSNHELFNNKSNLSVKDGFDFLLNKSINNEYFKKIIKLDGPGLDYFNYLDWSYEELDGIEHGKSSLISYGKELSYEGPNVVVQKGYLILFENLAKGLDIRYEKKVVLIEQENNGNYTITCSNNETLTCKYLVITVSIGVLKNNVIKFIPELPEKKLQTIKKLDMGLLNKILIEFESPFWDKEIKRISYISKEKGKFPWFDIPFKDKPYMLIWVAVGYAEMLENLPNEEILNLVLDVLSRMFNNKVTKIKNYYITKYGKDDNYFGSWAVRPVGSSEKENISLGENIGNIFFAGEATEYDNYGSVGAAWESGIKQANLLLNSINIR